MFEKFILKFILTRKINQLLVLFTFSLNLYLVLIAKFNTIMNKQVTKLYKLEFNNKIQTVQKVFQNYRYQNEQTKCHKGVIFLPEL